MPDRPIEGTDAKLFASVVPIQPIRSKQKLPTEK